MCGWALGNAVEEPTAWGVTGREELGGGLATVFKLENGFNLPTGASNGGLGFGRNAYVGLDDPTFGTITAGRRKPTAMGETISLETSSRAVRSILHASSQQLKFTICSGETARLRCVTPRR